MESTPIVAVDLAKNVFEIAVSVHPGRVRERRRLRRRQLLSYFGELLPCTVLLEACGSASYWARRLGELGHGVVLLPPSAVRRYRSRSKTDRADAKALLEAYRNEEIRPVPVKTVEQQTIGAFHRMRSAWMKARNQRMNTVRGLLRELGCFLPVGVKAFREQVWELVEDDESPLPEATRWLVSEAYLEVEELQRRIDLLERNLRLLAEGIPSVERYRSIPGVGLLTATALYAFVGDTGRFGSGRRFASDLGMTPKEHSSGHRRHLGSISKQGNRYLRTLLIHGARSALRAAKVAKEPSRLQRWALDLEARTCHNVAAVALANKMARIAWAISTRDQSYQPTAVAA